VSEQSSARELLLRSLDLSLLTSAHRYDVLDKGERDRSVTELSGLFFHLAGILGTDLFIECGAKDARSSRRARRRLNPRRIVAFEANPYTYRRFAKANAAPAHGVEYLHTALSDEVGTVTFNVLQTADGRPRSDVQASLLRRQDQLATGFAETTVDATTLDHFFAGDTSERIALWIDVEGAARNVLSGGTRLLDRAALLIIEVEDRRWWGEEQWLRADVASFLYERGMLPVARDFQSRYQYNMIFVRSGLLDTDRVRWLDEQSDDPAAARRRHEESIPLRRYGTPEEFGAAAAFLLSPAASFLTGVMLPVDGGLTRPL